LKGKSYLINRAAAMHFLRQGRFDVASVFIKESQSDIPEAPIFPVQTDSRRVAHPHSSVGYSHLSGSAKHRALSGRGPVHETSAQQKSWEQKSNKLQRHFTEMYIILQELKENRNLEPAIAWCQAHSRVLERQGSTLEFELCKLQFLCFFHGYVGSIVTEPDGMKRVHEAVQYARSAFARFNGRFKQEIQQLSGAVAFWSNLAQSPYGSLLASKSAWNDVALSFAKEYCNLLGLSPESPLHTCVSAGVLALPQLVKMRSLMRQRRTEWTTDVELPVEIDLPGEDEFNYHYIFICPVSKEQAIDGNPPMLLPCFHVICKESLDNVSRGPHPTFKCPYCPGQSSRHDAKKVYLVQRHEMNEWTRRLA